jgi:glycosyltransferase involved in cell wall biosynthesis
MNILYDHQAFTLQRFGGVSRYFAELIRFLQGRADVTVEHGVIRTLNEHFLEAVHDPRLRAPAWASGPVGAEGLRLLNSAASLWRLKGHRWDIFHPTYYNPYFLPFLGDTPFVITIHDMIHELMPDELPQSEAEASRRKRLLAGAAAHVIAVSHTTKRDLVREFGIPHDRVSVIYHAPSLDPTRTSAPGIELPSTYVLFVGKRSGYKNFDGFVRAASPVFARRPSLYLVCVGGGEFTRVERQLFTGLGFNERIVQVAVGDQDLSALYANAQLFVFPSRYEGFGLPLLEAFSCRCPVAAADTSCFREICGEAAAYFPPDDAAKISAVIERILDDPELAHDLREKGDRRSAEFTWQKTAEETFGVYSRIL